MTAGAVAQAAGVLRERILAIAAHAFEVDTDDVEFRQGRATVRGVPNRELSLADIADIATSKLLLSPRTSPPAWRSANDTEHRVH